MSTLSGTLRLDGDACRNGDALGRVCRTALRARDRETRALLRRCRVAPATVAARVADFTRLLKRVAPHWLDEAAGMASGAGIAVEQILAWNCLPGECSAPSGNNCTAFVWLGKERNLSFKIRDEQNRTQQFVIRALDNGATIQYGTDIGNLGIAHVLTSYGLSGSNDTGGYIVPRDGAPQLNDCHLLRYFAERASRVAEIPALFDRLAGMDAAGGAGADRGCVFLFADLEGGLRLETAREKSHVKELSRGFSVVSNHFLSSAARAWATRPPDVNTLLRHHRMTERLERHHGHQPLPSEVFAISRDRRHGQHSLCNDDRMHPWMTISAQLHVIEREAPEGSVNYVCCGNTRRSVYVPVALTERDNALAAVSGAFYRAADRLYRATGCAGRLPGWQGRFEKVHECPGTGDWDAAFDVLRKAGR